MANAAPNHERTTDEMNPADDIEEGDTLTVDYTSVYGDSPRKTVTGTVENVDVKGTVDLDAREFEAHLVEVDLVVDGEESDLGIETTKQVEFMKLSDGWEARRLNTRNGARWNRLSKHGRVTVTLDSDDEARTDGGSDDDDDDDDSEHVLADGGEEADSDDESGDEPASPDAPTDFADDLQALDEGDEVTFSTFAPGIGVSQNDITGTVENVEVESDDGSPFLGAHEETTVTVRAPKAERLRDDHVSVRRGTAGTERWELSTVVEEGGDEHRTRVKKLGGVGGGLVCGHLTVLQTPEPEVRTDGGVEVEERADEGADSFETLVEAWERTKERSDDEPPHGITDGFTFGLDRGSEVVIGVSYVAASTGTTVDRAGRVIEARYSDDPSGREHVRVSFENARGEEFTVTGNRNGDHVSGSVHAGTGGPSERRRISEPTGVESVGLGEVDR